MSCFFGPKALIRDRSFMKCSHQRFKFYNECSSGSIKSNVFIYFIFYLDMMTLYYPNILSLFLVYFCGKNLMIKSGHVMSLKFVCFSKDRSNEVNFINLCKKCPETFFFHLNYIVFMCRTAGKN